MKSIINQLEINSVRLILRKIPIFGGFSDKQLYEIFSVLEEARYSRGEEIFKEGDPPTHIYIILKGRVQFSKRSREGSHKIYEFGEGSCIGEESVIGIHPHTLSAIAVGDVELALISKKSLMDFYEKDIHLFSHLLMNISREISRRLRRSDNLLLHYISDPGPGMES